MHSGFPPSTKTNILKSQFELETVDERATLLEPLKFPFIAFDVRTHSCPNTDWSQRCMEQR